MTGSLPPFPHPAVSNAVSRLQDLEAECLKPEPSETLLEIGLSLLKFVSSHRGLMYVLFPPPPYPNNHPAAN
jgi:hypothetical protein